MPTTVVSYTTVERVWSAFPPINSATNIGSSTVAQYAANVEAEINGKIGKLYSLPLSVECPLLSAIAERETIYRIVVQRQLVQFPPAQQGAHPLQIQHKDDQKLLEQIASGEVSLLGADLVPIAADTAQTEVWSNTMNYRHTFTEDAFEESTVDENMLDDIDSGTLT